MLNLTLNGGEQAIYEQPNAMLRGDASIFGSIYFWINLFLDTSIFEIV